MKKEISYFLIIVFSITLIAGSIVGYKFIQSYSGSANNYSNSENNANNNQINDLQQNDNLSSKNTNENRDNKNNASNDGTSNSQSNIVSDPTKDTMTEIDNIEKQSIDIEGR